ncbi:hypothetical protein NK553_08490 [Pseudomonas sp. ZM23]|uniref:Uncharacterized protein n=1 Tax=Pseudomonas triclosanedens TaxID=2961893 RepID=A0ABY6ZZX1_9PSED|nr:hypothetical protein [Pseudomonas triclosanedens]MCP8463980.1 hypothetical protein [Pseudomonas triclosanedens]MCP8469064.1 hypothetical protein [Pseudomonas triclosanedens]MCP8475786.1 hypothetical protein [Pseudomonas triclosanedens]WAI50509.1 hypothetical protein OU419_04360 [Pseudomonas triclosanedens]
MTSQDYYSPTSYRPDRIPDQPASQARSLYQKFSCTRLPWGSTQDVIPASLLEFLTPEAMRGHEQRAKEKAEQIANGTYKPTPFDGIDLHQRYDHESLTMAMLSFKSQFWLLIGFFGKVVFFVDLFIVPCVYLLRVFRTGSGWFDTLWAFRDMILVAIVLPALMWMAGYFVTSYFPKFWFKPSRGPLWKLSRRTGLATLYDYKEFKKTGVIGEVSAPFYEFDAYIHTSPDRQGAPLNVLYLMHRYRDIRIKVGALLSADQPPNEVLALWDLLQNYMDTSRPLPDTPALEEYRAQDPVTAEHDRKTGRNPRYWVDMDDEAFKAKCREMAAKIDAIDTFSRPNLIAQHVDFAG